MAIEIAKCRTLDEKEEFLLSNNRISHIPKESKLSKILSRENPKRFSKVGEFFYFRSEEDSLQKYHDICKMVGEYMFEKYPILFEFYDEYLNGYTYDEENIKQIIKK